MTDVSIVIVPSVTVKRGIFVVNFILVKIDDTIVMPNKFRVKETDCERLRS